MSFRSCGWCLWVSRLIINFLTLATNPPLYRRRQVRHERSQSQSSRVLLCWTLMGSQFSCWERVLRPHSAQVSYLTEEKVSVQTGKKRVTLKIKSVKLKCVRPFVPLFLYFILSFQFRNKNEYLRLFIFRKLSLLTFNIRGRYIFF